MLDTDLTEIGGRVASVTLNDVEKLELGPGADKKEYVTKVKVSIDRFAVSFNNSKVQFFKSKPVIFLSNHNRKRIILILHPAFTMLL